MRPQGQHAVTHDRDAAAPAHKRRDPAPYRLLCAFCHGTQVHLHYALFTNTSEQCVEYTMSWLGMNTVDAWLWWALLAAVSDLRVPSGPMCQIMRQCTAPLVGQTRLVQRMLTVLDAVLCRACATMMSPCSSSAPRYVEPMGEESDHIQLVALTDALLVSLSSELQLRTPALVQ